MSSLVRWLKFNFVGAIGMCLQLAILVLLNRWWRGNYLWASAVAVELTLVHNFVWHQHYTWRDRSSSLSIASQLLRFHLSNGLVSLVGNLALMRTLVRQAHLPVLAANLIAVLSCSVVNFFLGNEWVFAAERPQECKA